MPTRKLNNAHIMTTAISLNKMLFFAHHGVSEQERTVGNRFEVSLCINADVTKALASDSLDDTINYAEVYDVVAKEMSIPSNLLEHVAGRIINAVKQRFPAVTGGTVTVAKLQPPFKSQIESVTVTVNF